MQTIDYRKSNNKKLTNSLEEYGLTRIQKYIPLYNEFFKLNETNWNSIVLECDSSPLECIVERNSENKYQGKFENEEEKQIFMKYAPLFDPVKFVGGKYRDISENDVLSLPIFGKKHIIEKVDRANNSSYVDGFFTFLSNKLKTKYNFIHGLEFYGSFTGVHKNLPLLVDDDIDYLEDNLYFFENNGILYDMCGNYGIEMLNFDTRKFKVPVHKDEKRTLGDDDCSIYSSITTDTFLQGIETSSVPENHSEFSFVSFDVERNVEKSSFEIKEKNKLENKNSIISLDEEESEVDSDENSVYSEVSGSSEENEESERESVCSEDENDDESGSDSELDSDDDEPILKLYVKNFPVNVIMMESLENTLDDYMTKNEISVDEWSSILIQIICTLITYQEVFDFTHNDLHTNNIMFSETDQEYIYYNVCEKTYKVPTYGKIYKIIDFGRGIYTYRGKQLISDNYMKDEDAYTQYNFGSIYDSRRSLCKPNKAFDLCRLGCSMIDEFVDHIRDIDSVDHPIGKLIVEWTTDDNGKNILYTPSGRERFEGFKLYRMIAKLVHKHTPKSQLERELFSKFEINSCELEKIEKNHIVDIDTIIQTMK
jgi:hypothetical protein